MNELAATTQLDQIVMLSLQDMAPSAIAKTLNISRYQVGKVLGSEEYKKRLNEIRMEAIETSLSIYLKDIAALRPLAFKALKKNLEQDNLEAVKEWAKQMGLNKQKDEGKTDSSITIVMPGAETPEKEIEVEVKEPV